MQTVKGDVATMPAPAFIPLDLSAVHHARPHRQHGNYYNRTKRKRDSSSQSGRSSSPGPAEPSPANLPPWSDPLYPYSRGTVGWVKHLYKGTGAVGKEKNSGNGFFSTHEFESRVT